MLPTFTWLWTLLIFVGSIQAVSWDASPFNPADFPLAVRTPYLSAWLPQGSGAALNDVWPTFWTGSVVGWSGFVKVDGQAYSFLGAPVVSGASFNKAVQKSSKFTATQSIFVLSAGPVDLTVTFLSPVEPTDFVKQSAPFSYMAVSAASTDGGSHSVQVYSDISAEWVSGDTSLGATWSTSTGSVITHQVQLANQAVLTEVNDHTQYGSAFYSTLSASGVSWQTGADVDVRAQFINNGQLQNLQDTNFRAIDDNWPVFALAHDLGNVGGSASAPVVTSIGHIRDPGLQYIVSGGGTQLRNLYFLSKYSTPTDVIPDFLNDYSAALGRANAFDSQLNSDASKISSDYASIVALSVRQSLGSFEITISKNSDGSYNTDDIIVFMKEISSDGNISTVDVIFPSWPIFLYTNPALGKYLLEGLFRYQATGMYPNKYSAHDIGSSYPNALGHNDGNDERMPLEESGNMVIMALSYAQKTNDLSHLQKYRDLLDQWTQFLISEALIPADQISTDDFAGSLANQTNLAIKGIVGIKAMAEIAALLGDSATSSNYSSIASSYVSQFQNLAQSSSGAHLTLSYGDADSWGLTYNLFGDKLLKLNLFPQSIYDQQTNWYSGLSQAYGIPLDTRHTYTKSDWEIWTAAIVTSTSVRDLFISSVRKWASDGRSSQPLGDWYETTNGTPEGFRARPVVGGHLGAALNDVWPTFWTGQILGWAGFVKVDGRAYSFLGAPAVSGASFTKAVQKSSKFTATQSIFVLSAGPVDLTVTFLSPVEPTDLVRQSIPFAYMAVSAVSTDGGTHSVQVYSDISAEWVSGDNNLQATWNTTTGSIITHQVQLANQAVLSEVADHTQYGSAFYSTLSNAGATWQTGADVTVRAQFINNGRLPNTQDTNFRAISNNWPVFALAHDLGNVGGSASAPVVTSVGHIRDPALQYIVAGGGTQRRSLYFFSKYSTPAALISDFLNDYSNALSRANTFDNKINSDASKISSDYASIVALSVRQSLGAIEITISKNSNGSFNTNDVIVFMKEISSDGNISTVDVIFPSWPIFLYTNPQLGKFLLEGLFRYQATGQYPNKWSVHDLGSSYPNALGHNDGRDEAMPVEESGNMIIMALSYAQKTGDLSHLQQYRTLLNQWTGFLITDSLIPANQISTDDFAGPLANQTNLAIKGIVGIKAMSQIASLLGDTATANNYSSIASNYVSQFQSLAQSNTGAHLTLSYGNGNSWGLTYNLFGDKLLKLNLFPQSLYQQQTNWYGSGIAQPFGIPLDTRHTYTKSDWEIWTAAIVTSTSVRDLFISSVRKWAADGQSSQPLGDWYETTNGTPEGFRARPVVGGHLALVSAIALISKAAFGSLTNILRLPLRCGRLPPPACFVIEAFMIKRFSNNGHSDVLGVDMLNKLSL
ncbi:hypothetical protein NP233_g5597 [Leucocoprinus birnbaumii]|uniref:DUF1793-domain-containing protein n=1 Tax=Leucocoprinus birnbaumii TaxID=56174 RepID=A0AAD5VTS5_9AGAR|nr:hypothetical protein NP233_g5597 [Leucocoprinus birnbaumii]